jgi:thioredoxin-related protein
MSTKILKLLMILVLVSFFTTGCYYCAAKKEMKSAEKLLSELNKEAGPQLVPYEYCSAEKFLETSKGEFGDNDFKQAKEFATRSKSAAQTGLTEVKKKK